MSKIIQLFIPLLFCGDEITDILYLCQNWNEFANQNLKNSALAFTLINAIVNFFITLYFMCLLKNISNSPAKKIVMLLCCGWIPVTAITFILVYGKFFQLIQNFGCLEQIYEKEKVKNIKQSLKFLHYVQLFCQDIPQIIIQSINNSETNKWELLEYISLAFSIAVIMYEILKFILCKEQNEDQQSQKDKVQKKRQESLDYLDYSYNLPKYSVYPGPVQYYYPGVVRY